MSIIYMDSKTFLKHFIKEQKDDTILGASYIIASDRIKFGAKYKDRIMKFFYVPDECLIKLNDEKEIKSKSNSEYVKTYFDMLKRNDIQIATLVKITVQKGLTTIILTTSLEDRTFGHLELLREYIESEYGYKIMRYRPGMKINDEKEKHEKNIVKRCDKNISKRKKQRKRKQMKTYKGQQQYFSGIGKKKLKRMLRKNGLYLDGMSESEMIDVAIIFLV